MTATWVLVGDAGHDGYDSGAVGPTGLLEATVTKAVRDEWAALCNVVPQFEVYSTRSIGAYSLNDDLAIRTEQANTWYDPNRNNLFISFHVNCDDSPNPSYISTWIQAYGGEAGKAANIVQKRLCEGLDFEKYGLEDAGIKTANFYVLRKTLAPAILVELGFISNPGEESALRTSAVQKQIARIIYNATLEYTGVSARKDPTVVLTTPTKSTIFAGLATNNTMYVPVRAFATALGCTVDFDSANNSAIVTKR